MRDGRRITVSRVEVRSDPITSGQRIVLYEDGLWPANVYPEEMVTVLPPPPR